MLAGVKNVCNGYFENSPYTTIESGEVSLVEE